MCQCVFVCVCVCVCVRACVCVFMYSLICYPILRTWRMWHSIFYFLHFSDMYAYMFFVVIFYYCKFFWNNFLNLKRIRKLFVVLRTAIFNNMFLVIQPQHLGNATKKRENNSDLFSSNKCIAFLVHVDLQNRHFEIPNFKQK